MKIIREINNNLKQNTKSKILVLGLILIVLVGVFSPFTTHAQVAVGTCTFDANFGNTNALPNMQTISNTTQANCTGLHGVWAQGQTGNGTSQYNQVAPSGGTTSCGVSNLWNPLSFFWCILETASSLIQKMTAFILWLSGMILDFVVKYTIITMAEKVKNFTGINIAWKIIRDLMNITFIFLLVYEGIKMIIGLGSRDGIKRLIGGIVLASILINFSLFFTKILIDASNIVTVGFYNIAIGSSTAKATVDGAPPSPISGLSVPFMNSLGLTDFYSVNTANVAISADGGGMVIFYLLGAVVFIVTAFIFFAVACMLTIRYITLLFLLMLSPIAYMGLALPSMKGYASQWWESLRGQLIFAPVFMIMVLIILTLMGSADFLTHGSGAWGKVMSGDSTASQDALTLMFNFVVIIGLLIVSLITAKSTASRGSKLIGQATGKLTSFAGGAIMGGAARVQRNTIGRMGSSMANDENLKKRAETSIVARMQLAAANRAATSTFDARTVSGIGSLGKATGMNFKVDAKKENFREEAKKRDDDAAKRAEQYKPTDLAAQQAKNKLDVNTEEGRKFRDEEEERKHEHEKLINSEEYLAEKSKKEQKKRALDQQDSNTINVNEVNIRDAKQRLETAKNKMASTAINVDKKQLKADIEKFENEIREREKTIRDVKYNVEERDKVWKNMEEEEKNFISDERKALIATAGGTKNEKGVIKDAAGNTIGREIKSAYEQRTAAIASRIENAGPVKRYTTGILGAITNVAGITAPPRTKAERQELARKTRKLSGKKTAEQELAEAAKKLEKERKQKAKEAGEPDDDEETPPTPAEPPVGGAPTT